MVAIKTKLNEKRLQFNHVLEVKQIILVHSRIYAVILVSTVNTTETNPVVSGSLINGNN